jgi:hypothetical protein
MCFVHIGAEWSSKIPYGTDLSISNDIFMDDSYGRKNLQASPHHDQIHENWNILQESFNQLE